MLGHYILSDELFVWDWSLSTSWVYLKLNNLDHLFAGLQDIIFNNKTKLENNLILLGIIYH